MVSLRGAAELLGVHPATVRNWADKGEIRRGGPGRTPSLPADRSARHMHQQDELQPIEVRSSFRTRWGRRGFSGDGQLAQAPWYAAMREETRQAMRAQGRAMLEALRSIWRRARRRALTCDRHGQTYAVALIADGLTLPDAVRGLLYFGDL